MQSGCTRTPLRFIFEDFVLLVLLSLSILGLGLGAALVALGRMRLPAAHMLDGLVLGMVPTLVIARLLPHAFESLGPYALAYAACGFGLVTLSHQSNEHTGLRLTSALVIPALWLHAVADGAALAMSSSERVGDTGSLLAAAAILHRVPEGLFIASRRRPLASSALFAVWPLAFATVLGAVLGERVFDVLPDSALDAVLAVGSGAMLRLLGHSHGTTSPQPLAAKAFGGLGFVCGIVVVLATPGPNDVLLRAQPRELAVASSLVPLFIECAPAVLLGVAALVVLRMAAGTVSSDALRVRGPWQPALRGLLFGLIQPRGFTPVLPASARLFALRSPTAAVLALGSATATLGLDAALLSWQLLGGAVTIGRLVGSACMAFAGAWLASQLTHSLSPRPMDVFAQRYLEPTRDSRPGFAPERQVEPVGFAAQLREAVGHWLDHSAGWLVFGLLLAAAFEAAVSPELLARFHAPWDWVLAALLALPAGASALAITPLAAVLLHKGASLGAVLAFLWLTPVMNLPMLSLIRTQLGTRAAAAFLTGGWALAAVLGTIANRWLPTSGVPAMHPLVAHVHVPAELACAALVAGALLVTLLRLGPRALAASLTAVVPHVHAPVVERKSQIPKRSSVPAPAPVSASASGQNAPQSRR